MQQRIKQTRNVGHSFGKITPEIIKQVIKKLNKSTAVGIDQWSPAVWRDISPEAVEELAKLLNHVEQKVAWPAHIYHNLIVLMGKPAGGTRPIALMPMIYRLWTKIRREQIDSWEQAWAGPWDAAVKGSSALRAAILGMLQDEVAVYRGRNTLTTLWDEEKFYDNIDILQLINKSKEVEYPIAILILGLQLHMSPRGLKCYHHCPGPVLPRSGIIAGCSQSFTFARILLYKILKYLWDGYQASQAYGLSYCPNNEDTAEVGSFVDDLKTTTHGTGESHVEIHKNMGENLIRDLKGLKAKVSKKNATLARRKRDSLALQKHYQTNGVRHPSKGGQIFRTCQYRGW